MCAGCCVSSQTGHLLAGAPRLALRVPRVPRAWTVQTGHVLDVQAVAVRGARAGTVIDLSTVASRATRPSTVLGVQVDASCKVDSAPLTGGLGLRQPAIHRVVAIISAGLIFTF